MSLLAAPALAGLGRPLSAWAETADTPIASADQALDVFDLERVARAMLPPAHYGYLATGVDGDATLRANTSAFSNYELRVRRMRDLSRVDMSVTLFARTWDSPIYLNPIGSQRAFHAEGELAAARAAGAKKHLQVLSTVSSVALEDVAQARGEAPWYQLYPTDQWPVTRGLIRRARAAGCPALVLTVDLQGGSNRLTAERGKRLDARDCQSCHGPEPKTFGDYVRRKPMFRGLDVSKVRSPAPLDLDWDYVKRLRDDWSGPLLIKGLVTREDAELALEHGVDGIVVSNHGGRAKDSGRAAIDSLVEVVEGVRDRVPVLVDSGFRRGSDIFKALALGATAVGIGRPYIWGLAAFGQAGVERVLDLLRRELRIAMGQAGTRTLAEITPEFVMDRRRR